MPFTTVTPGSWVAITTTTADTVFQNQSPREVYLVTGATGGLTEKEGYLLTPWVGSVIIGTGLAVSARSQVSDAKILYMTV